MPRHSHLAAGDDESRKNVFRQRGLPTTLPRSRGSWEAMKTGANILNSEDKLPKLGMGIPPRLEVLRKTCAYVELIGTSKSLG